MPSPAHKSSKAKKRLRKNTSVDKEEPVGSVACVTEYKVKAKESNLDQHPPEELARPYHDDKLKRVHSDSPSLFSSDSNFQNYRGILNLCILLMILSNFRVALDNVLKYGVLVDPKILLVFLEDPYSWPSALLVLGSNFFIQISFATEWLLSKDRISESIGRGIHIVNHVLILLCPVAVVFIYHPPPWSSTLALGWYTILWLKLISYFSVNKWLREYILSKQKKKDKDSDNESTTTTNSEESKDDLVKYPDNLNQTDLYYFLAAPTLCYELNFPRTPRIRYRFLIRRIFETLFLMGLLIALCQQWIVPTVKNSMRPFQELDYPRFLERIMKLALPNHFLWLIFFYCFFHSGLNILAEVLKFGDRTFYNDWWNANTINYFWQNWNIPIHRWAKRHLYQPMLRHGISKIQASIIVFFLSAFFHEFLVSVPLRMLKCWAFLGMIAQIPYSIIISKFFTGNYGNTAVWVSLILGQPFAILMYYHDYFVMHYEVKNTTFVYKE